MFTQAALLALAALTPLVNAHGSMNKVVIDGTAYPGPVPNSDGGQFAIREVFSVDPVKGTDNSNLSCGQNAQPAALVADANPGSQVGFSWMNGEGGAWVHNTGPVMTYMASCGSGSCTTFDSSQAEWFKIDEQGRNPDGTWAMSDYNDNPDKLLNVTLPTNLPAGEYLIRHELLALHNSMSEGGAEFYPSCIQVRMSASSRADAKVPSGNDVVTFPGGYSATDPGILVPGIYDPGLNYVFPGPAVQNDSEGSTAGSSGSSGSPDPTGSDAANNGTPTSSDASSPTPTAGSGSGSGCGNGSRKMKKRYVKRIIRQEVRKLASKAKRSAAKPAQQVQAAVKRDVHHPVRTNSRVMRGLNNHN